MITAGKFTIDTWGAYPMATISYNDAELVRVPISELFDLRIAAVKAKTDALDRIDKKQAVKMIKNGQTSLLIFYVRHGKIDRQDFHDALDHVARTSTWLGFLLNLLRIK